MSKASIDFFKYIRIHVSRFIELMEQNQIERSTKLLKFENEFKVVNFGICGAIFHL
jgi:kinesin family protein 11